jgi:halocyanin-like protein
MDDSEYTRRGLLRTGAGAAVGLGAVSAGGTAAAQQDAYDSYLSDEGTWGGETIDATGREQFQVDVGARGNSGTNAFNPAAVLVDPGTMIQWVWTGNGSHNVVEENDAFESELTNEAGFTFERTFSEPGVTQYYCLPHRALGMKGVVVVGEENAETDLVSISSGEGGGLRPGVALGGAAVFGTVSLLGVAAYRELFGDIEPTE